MITQLWNIDLEKETNKIYEIESVGIEFLKSVEGYERLEKIS